MSHRHTKSNCVHVSGLNVKQKVSSLQISMSAGQTLWIRSGTLSLDSFQHTVCWIAGLVKQSLSPSQGRRVGCGCWQCVVCIQTEDFFLSRGSPEHVLKHGHRHFSSDHCVSQGETRHAYSFSEEDQQYSIDTHS